MKTVLGLILLAVVAMPVRTEELNVTDGNYLLGSCQITVRKLDNPDTTHDIAPLKPGPSKGYDWRENAHYDLTSVTDSVTPHIRERQGAAIALCPVLCPQ